MPSLHPPRPGRASLALALSALIAGLLPLTAQALSLEDAIEKALRADPTYLAAEKTLQAGRESRPKAVSGLFPTLTGTAVARQVDTGASSNLDYRSYTALITQPVFNLSLLRAAQQGSQKVMSSEATFGKARQDTLLRVASAYFDVLTAQNDLGSVRAEKAAIAQQLEQAKRSFEVGTATITDQQEAQARFDLILASEIRAQNSLDVRRNALSLIIREALPSTIAAGQGGLRIPEPQPKDANAWVEQARQHGFLVKKAQADLETARLEIGRQFSGHLPSLNLVAARSINRETSTSVAQSDYNYIGLEVSLSFALGGGNYANVREAAALKSKADFDLEAAQLDAEQAARSAYLNLLAGLSQVSALEAAERSSQLALESNRLGYEVGVRINIDVLNAQQQLYTAQRDLSKARYDTLLASLQLKAAVGALEFSDLQAVSRLLAAR